MSNAAARQRPADIRLALKAAGFSPVACIGKEPVLPEWQNRRDATPEEIAGPILFLCSQYSGFITGEVFNVNGGAVLIG